MILSLRQHWPHRKMEWLMSGLTASWGGYVLANPAIFTDTATVELFSGLNAMTPSGIAPNVFWGMTTLVVGLCRAVALYINGAHFRTPMVRVIGSFITMFVFSQITIGLWQTGIANPGLVVYSWLIAADMLSAYAAGKDAMTAEVHRRLSQGTLLDDSRFSRAISRL